MQTATAFSTYHLSRALVIFLQDLDPCLAYKASSEYLLTFVHEPHSSNFKKAFLVFFHTYTYIILGLFSSALLLRSIFPFEQELRAARVLWEAFLVFFRLEKLFLTSLNIHIHNIPFKPELQIAFDCTPKLFTVHLMRRTNCESHDLLTHVAVNFFSP